MFCSPVDWSGWRAEALSRRLPKWRLDGFGCRRLGEVILGA
jgi:hypothetical protein